MSTDELNKRLQAFMDSDDEGLKKLAQELQTLYEGVYRNIISVEQFKELANDLIEAEKVNRHANALERKISVLEALNTVKTIIGLIPT